MSFFFYECSIFMFLPERGPLSFHAQASVVGWDLGASVL